MNRRTFIAGLGNAAAWPLAARAQQPERIRRIGVLMSLNENDPEEKLRMSAFTKALADLGWTDGHNVRIDFRWGRGEPNRIQSLAKELVDPKPDIILTDTTPATVAVQRETRTIPIVFARVADPVASGIVARLDRPNGNITGTTTLDRRPLFSKAFLHCWTNRDSHAGQFLVHHPCSMSFSIASRAMRF
jgi:putative ABC transport system substrate-binding protein